MTKRYTVCLNPINILGGRGKRGEERRKERGGKRGEKRRKERGGEEEREGRRGGERGEEREERRGGERGEEREERRERGGEGGGKEKKGEGLRKIE